MRNAVLGAVLTLALVEAGCGGSEPPSASSAALGEERDDEPGATRASREAQREGALAEREAPAVPRASAPRPALILRRVDVARAEDGRGAMVEARDAVAFDVDGALVPARAIDPVLHVGDLALTHYEYTDEGAARFVLAELAAIPAGEPVRVQYGDDASAARVLAASVPLERLAAERVVEVTP